MSSKKLTRQQIKTFVLILPIVACGMLGIDIHLASLPNIMQYMHTDKDHIQQSISIFLLGTGSSLLFYGPLSDKYGRKPVIIFGMSLATLSSFAAAFTHQIDSF